MQVTKGPAVFCFSYLMDTVRDYETSIVQVQGPQITHSAQFSFIDALHRLDRGCLTASGPCKGPPHSCSIILIRVLTELVHSYI